MTNRLDTIHDYLNRDHHPALNADAAQWLLARVDELAAHTRRLTRERTPPATSSHTKPPADAPNATNSPPATPTGNHQLDTANEFLRTHRDELAASLRNRTDELEAAHHELEALRIQETTTDQLRTALNTANTDLDTARAKPTATSPNSKKAATSATTSEPASAASKPNKQRRPPDTA